MVLLLSGITKTWFLIVICTCLNASSQVHSNTSKFKKKNKVNLNKSRKIHYPLYSTVGGGLISKRIEKSLMAILWVWTTCYKPSNCGKALKQFQPSKHGNIVYGTGNDSWYGKIEIDARKEMGNPQQSSMYNGMQFID